MTVVNPPGSCLAFPSGPVPAGQQLEKLVTDPNAPVKAGTGAVAVSNVSATTSSAVVVATPTSTMDAVAATNSCGVLAKKKKHPKYNRDMF